MTKDEARAILLPLLKDADAGVDIDIGDLRKTIYAVLVLLLDDDGTRDALAEEFTTYTGHEPLTFRIAGK